MILDNKNMDAEGGKGKFLAEIFYQKTILDMSKMKNGQQKSQKSLLLLQNAV